MNRIYHSLGLIALGILFLISLDALPGHATTGSIEINTILGNPAAVYCKTIMGYDYSTITAEDGSQSGVCAMPDGEICSEWDFYAGKCGQAHSWCVQAGYALQARQDGKDPYSSEYSVCVDELGNQVGSTASLSGLNTLSRGSSLEIPMMKTEQASMLPPYNPEDIPADFLWLNFLGKDWITPVKDQGTCGSCWAFAAVGVAEAQGNIIAKDPTLDWDLAEAWLVSPWCDYCGDCNGGSPGLALYFISADGIPLEYCYPYSIGLEYGFPKVSACPPLDSPWLHVPNIHGYSLTDTDLKYVLSHYGPVIISMGMNASYGGYWDDLGIYRCLYDSQSGFPPSTDHAVLAVGYNDSVGVWWVKNSWGVGWGYYGYFALGYHECNVDSGSKYWVQSRLPYPEVFLPVIRR